MSPAASPVFYILNIRFIKKWALRNTLLLQLQLCSDVRLAHLRPAEQPLAALVLALDDVLEALLEALAEARGLVAVHIARLDARKLGLRLVAPPRGRLNLAQRVLDERLVGLVDPLLELEGQHKVRRHLLRRVRGLPLLRLWRRLRRLLGRRIGLHGLLRGLRRLDGLGGRARVEEELLKVLVRNRFVLRRLLVERRKRRTPQRGKPQHAAHLERLGHPKGAERAEGRPALHVEGLSWSRRVTNVFLYISIPFLQIEPFLKVSYTCFKRRLIPKYPSG